MQKTIHSVLRNPAARAADMNMAAFAVA